MSGTAVALRDSLAVVPAGAEKQQSFEDLVLSFGNPADVTVVASASSGSGDVDIDVVRASNKKSLCLTSPVMLLSYVKDTLEGDLGGKGEFDSTKRVNARFTTALTVGVIRPENKVQDPLIETRQRAWLENGRRTCDNILGAIFDSDASKLFADIKGRLIAGCVEVEREVLASGIAAKNEGMSAAEVARLVDNEINTNAAVGEKIRLKARGKFIAGGKNAFATKHNNTDPLFVKGKVYTVRPGRLAAHQRGKRPDGPALDDLPSVPENWPDIYLRTGKEYTWSPYTYRQTATEAEIPRPLRTYRVTAGKRRKIMAMMTVQALEAKRDKIKPDEKAALRLALNELDATTALAGDDAMVDIAMPDPEWSPIHGLKWRALASLGVFVSVYKMTDGGYGTTLSPVKNIGIFDRVASTGKNGPAVGGDHAAASAVARDFLSEELDAALLALPDIQSAAAPPSPKAGDKRKAEDDQSSHEGAQQ